MNEQPLVSIGMPVYNGEKYIRQALDSLLAQDYENFELIISDNASTDQTPAICREYAARDRRIRYFRNEQNMGANWNFQRVLNLSSAKYFMWAAHDDMWDSNYVSECLDTLEQNPEAVLCCALLRFIDQDGNQLPSDHPNLDTTGMDLRRRVQALMSQRGWFAIYGLINSDALKSVHPGNDTWGGDVIIQLELLLLGGFVRASETCFYYRLLRKTVKDYELAINLAGDKQYLLHPYTRMVLNLLRTVRKSELSLVQKALLQWDILLSTLFLGPDMPKYIREENRRQFFECYQMHDMGNVRQIAPFAFLLNPDLALNRGAWSILVRSIWL